MGYKFQTHQGTTADSVVDAGAVGSLHAKLRRISTDINSIVTAVQVLDNAISGTEQQVDVVTLPTAIQGPGNPTIDSYSTAAINLAASTTNQVLASSAASKQIWVYGLYMMADTAAGTVTLQDEDDTALSGTMAVSDEGGWVLPMSGNFAMPWIKCATDKDLECDTGACTIDGILTYAIVSV